MPIYRYSHNCGFEQKLFLSVNKEYVTVPCFRCGRMVTAKQIRDKSIETKQINEGTGVLRKDDKHTNRRR